MVSGRYCFGDQWSVIMIRAPLMHSIDVTVCRCFFLRGFTLRRRSCSLRIPVESEVFRLCLLQEAAVCEIPVPPGLSQRSGNQKHLMWRRPGGRKGAYGCAHNMKWRMLTPRALIIASASASASHRRVSMPGHVNTHTIVTHTAGSFAVLLNINKVVYSNARVEYPNLFQCIRSMHSVCTWRYCSLMAIHQWCVKEKKL